MLKYHKDEYTTKCKEEGFKTLDKCDVVPDINLDTPQPAFTREGLIERLVCWMAVDDQVNKLS
jgi:hypothetical protein